MKSKPFPPPKARSTNPLSPIASEYRHIMIELDRELLQRHPSRKAKGRWQGRFVVASWVRFPEGLMQRVNLILVYRDSDRRKSYRVDTCRANRQSLILLNGRVDLDFAGEVSDVALVLEGLAEDSVWILDEFRIEPAGAAVSKTKPLSRLVSV